MPDFGTCRQPTDAIEPSSPPGTTAQDPSLAATRERVLEATVASPASGHTPSQQGLPAPDDPSFGRVLGRILSIHPKYAFVLTRQLGTVFVHRSDWPHGLENLVIGQYLEFEVRTNAQGRYGMRVRMLDGPPTEAHAVPANVAWSSPATASDDGSSPSPDDPSLGIVPGRVVGVFPRYAFVLTQTLGTIFVHRLAWPQGLETLAIGQY
ncbi:MAG: hypothetical protein EOM24_23205, partial [Chloroflexia bacterium]|nr:hypothetical protein [Chloroflexia bacterium]